MASGGRFFTNPVLSLPGTDHGDPFVLRYRGRYLLYHTADHEIPVYESIDLVNWTRRGTALAVRPGHPAQCQLWAPEVAYRDGVFHLYLAATRYGPNGVPDDRGRRLWTASSPDPLGPFRWSAEPLIPDAWSIDAHPYRDSDGGWWLFYNVRDESTRYPDGTIGCGNVVDRLPAPDRVAGHPVPVAVPSARWEGNRDGTWYWNEGAWVVRRPGGWCSSTAADGSRTRPTGSG
jgi:GH43 family beta-xylosidase